MFKEKLTEKDLATMTKFVTIAAKVNGSSLEKVARKMQPSYYKDYLRFACYNTNTTIKLSKDGEVWLRTTEIAKVDSFTGKCNKQISHKDNGATETRLVSAPSLSSIQSLVESLL